MEDKINFFTKLKISMFKPSKYNLLLKDGLNKALLFLGVITIIVGAFFGMTLTAVTSVIEVGTEEILTKDDFKFTLTDGVLNFENSPFIQEEGKTVLLIDSNVSIDNTDSIRSQYVHKETSLLFLKDGIIARMGSTEQKLKYSDIPMLPSKLDNEQALSMVSKLKPLKYIVFIVAIIITFLEALVNALVVSVAGLLSNKMNGANLKYVDIFKLSIYSLTLPLFLGLILPSATSFTILISAFCVTMAIGNIRAKQLMDNK